MSKALNFTLTRETVTVYLDGEAYTVAKGQPNFDRLRTAVIQEEWHLVPDLVTPDKVVEVWAKDWFQDEEGFVTQEGSITFQGEKLPEGLCKRILDVAGQNKNPKGLLNFWRRLKRNPEKRSRDQLWDFLKHINIPVQDDGTFLTYKGVRRDFRDGHSGTIDNSPGKTVRMDRSKISTDPNHTCHVGLHVGAFGYAGTFSERTVIVRVDPEHVCCVPADYNGQKMRVCEYYVVGLYGAELPSDTFNSDVEATPAAPIPEDDFEDDEDLSEEEEIDEDEGVVKTVAKAKATKAPAPAEGQSLPLTGTPWDYYNTLDPLGLKEQSLDDLRKYARYNCLILGASKMPGGKDALIQRILEVRQGKLVPLVVEETPALPKDQPTEGQTSLPRKGTPWDHFNEMDMIGLLKQSIDDLRKYAHAAWMIVGASKMPGGKVALVSRICEVREQR